MVTLEPLELTRRGINDIALPSIWGMHCLCADKKAKLRTRSGIEQHPFAFQQEQEEEIGNTLSRKHSLDFYYIVLLTCSY